MNRKGYGRRRAWPNSRYNSSFYQKLLRKTTSILSQSSLYPVRELNGKLPSVKQIANLSKATFSPLVKR